MTRIGNSKWSTTSFEQIVVAIEAGDIVDIIGHPNKTKYPDQLVILVHIDDYIYAVPTAIKKGEFFLKTIYPSRKYTAQYLSGKGS
jgi:hypothetical protein